MASIGITNKKSTNLRISGKGVASGLQGLLRRGLGTDWIIVTLEGRSHPLCCPTPVWAPRLY